jgi:RecA-family ATPase
MSTEAAELNVPEVTPARQPEGFRALALRAVARGESRVLPIAVGGKNPLMKWKASELDLLPEAGWLTKANIFIDAVAKMFPDANCCVIAKPDEKCFIDEDSDDFRTGFEEWAIMPFPRTFTTSARAGHKQSHWLQTDATRKLGNVGQDQTGGILSFRQNNLYVLSEGSQYKDCVHYYDVVDNSAIAPMPDALVQYIQHLIALKVGENKKNVKSPTDTAPRNERGKVPVGSIHNYMLGEAGRMRHLGMTQEEIEVVLLRKVHENCEGDIDDRKVIQMSKSICNFEPSDEVVLVLDNHKPSAGAPTAAAQAPMEKQPIVITEGDQFLSEEIPPRKVLVTTINGLEPMIFEQSINQIFAWRGVGKTCLGLGFVRAMATGGSFLNFQSSEPVHVLYVEGELPDSQMQERWRSIVGKTNGYAHLASVDKQPGHHFVSLASEDGMARVEAALMELQKQGINVKVLMLDNISTLFNIAANDEEVWITIQAWLISLRSRGLTVFYFHHAGKGGLSRSHSKSEDMLDVSIKLEEPDEPEAGHLHAVMTFDKARAGLSERASEIKLHRTHSQNCGCGGKQTISFCPGDGVRWEHIPKRDKKAEAYELFAAGATADQVATQLDVAFGTVKTWRTNWGKQRLQDAGMQR